MTLYVHSKCFRADGTTDSYATTECESTYSPLWWQVKNLSFTSSGYGKRIPTTDKVLFNGKWRRVYVCIYSNSGTAYLGKLITGRGAELTVSNY